MSFVEVCMIQRITNTHPHSIKIGAAEEINISHSDRSTILSRLEKSPLEAGRDPKLYLKAKAETITMMSPFMQRFLDRMTTTNINDDEVQRRWRTSIFLTVFSVVLVGILMWIQTWAAAPFDNRGWRLLALPFYFWACGFMLSARNKV